MRFKVDVLATTKVRTKNSFSHTARIDIEGSGIGPITVNLSEKVFELFDRSINHKGTLKCEFTIQEKADGL